MKSLAAKRFSKKYQHYLVDNIQGEADLIIELGKFQLSDDKAYLFNHYRISQNSVVLKNRYKIAKWLSEVSPYGEFPVTVKLDGNYFSQISMVDITLGYLIIWFLSLKGLMPVHAGAVVKAGKGTILTGRRGVGKTTLVGKLFSKDYKMVSEDRVFLHDGKIKGFRLPANIKYDRKDPGIAKLPFKTKAKVMRNRFLSILSFNYLTLLEPVPLQNMLPGKLEDEAKATKLVYLQSSGQFQINTIDDKSIIAEQIVRGNMFDFLLLRQEQTAYNYAIPQNSNNDYWDMTRNKTFEAIKDLEVVKVEIPVKPTDDHWGQLISFIER